MKKLIGLKKIKTAVFISGTGSNLKNLIKFSKTKISPILIKLIISSSKKAKGLRYPTQYNIEKKIVNFNNNFSENKILNYINKKNIKFICLAGFMKILSKNFIKKFKGKIVNIHPSLLPNYKGLNTYKRALKNKEKFTGCTVHYVTAKLDSGKIILQKKIKIKKKDTINSLKKKILKKELLKPTKIYVKEILNLIKNNLINGCANITGGGLEDNIRRVIPEGLTAEINLNKIKTKKIFSWIKENNINDKEMLKTFNCGVGFCLIINPKNFKKIKSFFTKEYEPYIIGKITSGKNKIKLNEKINWS